MSYYQDNKEHLKKYLSEWVKQNPEKRKAIKRKSYLLHKKSINKKSLEYNLQNPGVFGIGRANWVSPGSSVSWANKFLMNEIYLLAKLRTKLLGEKWEVDHIIPLNHPQVCGLHNEFNLQVITKKANLEKQNRAYI